MRLLGDRVLVLLPERAEAHDASTGYSYQQDEVTTSGIILAKPSDAYDLTIATRGIVAQIGTRKGVIDVEAAVTAVQQFGGDVAGAVRAIRRAGPAPFEVQVGDCVVFPPSAGEQIDLDGHSYVILRSEDVLARLDPKEQAA